MKAAGALLILSGAFSFGVMLCREQSRRLRLLRELLSALEQLQGELELRSPTLPDLFISAAKRCQGEICGFLRAVSEDMQYLGERSFCEIWASQVQCCLGGLGPSEREEMIRLGRVLGRLDLEAELRSLSACRDALSRELEQLREQAPSRRRLTLGLSAAAGILSVILMI